MEISQFFLHYGINDVMERFVEVQSRYGQKLRREIAIQHLGTMRMGGRSMDNLSEHCSVNTVGSSERQSPQDFRSRERGIISVPPSGAEGD